MSLIISPAFGFETTKWNNKSIYREKLRAEVEAKIEDCFKNKNIVVQSNCQKEQKEKILNTLLFINADLRYRLYNTLKVCAYIPFIGTLFGIVRIVKSHQSQEPPLKKFTHIVRGMIEFLSLGFLLIIPDLILTLSKPGEVKFHSLSGYPELKDKTEDQVRQMLVEWIS